MPQLARIKIAPETEKLGLAGKIGEVWGFTTPSSSAESVVGVPFTDYAENIFFPDTKQELWFAEHLIEHVDHDPALEITIGGKRLFYTSDGRWQQIEQDTGTNQPDS